MIIYSNQSALDSDIGHSLDLKKDKIKIIDEKKLKNEAIDKLVYTAILSPDEKLRQSTRLLIRKIALLLSARPASIHNLYKAFGRGEVSGLTVPAINIRTLTYDIARLIFKLASTNKIGPFIFEIARSEISYTLQPPDEYSVCILAAAIKEGYQGPIFIQGDHYQFKASVYQESPEIEINKLKDLIKKSILASFYNIDIDASTLVDLSKTHLEEQQKENYQMTYVLTKYIRSIQPKDIIVSVGGEIGHIGGKNSTLEEFNAFMKGCLKAIQNEKIEGLSKISVQTGTSHGGIPLPDGTIAKINLDFNVLKNIGQAAREKFQIGGPVQHGASTLPDDLFDQFPKVGTLEIHLATGFQNIIYNNLSKNLKEKIYQWIKENLKDEWKPGLSEEQFIYKTRKKAFGPFKYQLWMLTTEEKKPILQALKDQFELIFNKLNVFNTKSLVSRYI